MEAPRNPAGSNFEPSGLKQFLEGLRRSAGSRFESDGPEYILEGLASDFEGSAGAIFESCGLK